MKITIEKLKDWDLVYKTALYTQGKNPLQQFPTEKWKHKTVVAQHSPLRQLEFLVRIMDSRFFRHTTRSRNAPLFI